MKNELSIVKNLREKFVFPQNLGIGIGDDSAVVNFENKALITTDLMVENVHFELSYTSFYHIGFKIVSVNVSDIYAMGGSFKGFLLSVAIPEEVDEKALNELFNGLQDALKIYGGYLIGGDLSKSERVFISGIALGETDSPVLRKGAQIGDSIYITSYLGLSAAGLHLLQNFSEDEKSSIKLLKEFSSIKFGQLLQRHLMPQARKPFKFTKYANAMMDISDGLLIDLFRLCEENSVGAEIYVENLPVFPELYEAAKILNIDMMKLILSGGEDYELLVVSDKDLSEMGLFRIGKIIDEKGIYLVNSSKERIKVKPEGWLHFHE